MNKKIKRYKTVIDILLKRMIDDGVEITKDELDEVIKGGAGLFGSTTKMKDHELNYLLEHQMYVANNIGLVINKNDKITVT